MCASQSSYVVVGVIAVKASLEEWVEGQWEKSCVKELAASLRLDHRVHLLSVFKNGTGELVVTALAEPAVVGDSVYMLLVVACLLLFHVQPLPLLASL